MAKKKGATSSSKGATQRPRRTAAKAAPAEVPWDWQRWAAAAAVNEETQETIAATMVADGVDEKAAETFIAALAEPSPGIEAARWYREQLRKLESVLDAQRRMAALVPEHYEIDRRHGLSGEAFLREYYSKNRPVIMDDFTASWPALERWTPHYLRAVLGDAEVEIMTGRESDERYELNHNRRRVPFAEFVDTILETKSGNDVYLTANNKLLATEVAKPLWDDFTFDPEWLVPDPGGQYSFFWFGPSGTVTPYHHDNMNILFNQILGKKEITLVSAHETPRMYNSIGVYTDIDPLDPDYERFPLYADVHPVTVTVGPGETLFIPVGWWHHVVASELSISISFANFAFPNTFEWDHPTIEL